VYGYEIHFPLKNIRIRVPEKRFLKEIFLVRSNRRLEKLHIEKLHNFYSPNTVRSNKCRRVKWVRHVARIEKKRNKFKV
jgi:hypothetical protein